MVNSGDETGKLSELTHQNKSFALKNALDCCPQKLSYLNYRLASMKGLRTI